MPFCRATGYTACFSLRTTVRTKYFHLILFKRRLKTVSVDRIKAAAVETRGDTSFSAINLFISYPIFLDPKPTYPRFSRFIKTCDICPSQSLFGTGYPQWQTGSFPPQIRDLSSLPTPPTSFGSLRRIMLQPA